MEGVAAGDDGEGDVELSATDGALADDRLSELVTTTDDSAEGEVTGEDDGITEEAEDGMRDEAEDGTADEVIKGTLDGSAEEEGVTEISMLVVPTLEVGMIEEAAGDCDIGEVVDGKGVDDVDGCRGAEEGGVEDGSAVDDASVAVDSGVLLAGEDVDSLEDESVSGLSELTTEEGRDEEVEVVASVDGTTLSTVELSDV